MTGESGLDRRDERLASVATRDVPESRRDDVVEVLHGRSIADPYRWLEDDPGDWIDQQNAATERYLSGLAGRSYFATQLREIVARPWTSMWSDQVRMAGFSAAKRGACTPGGDLGHVIRCPRSR